MAVVQLFGFGAFAAASLLVGLRLLRLWLRTRQWPELTIGAAFLLAGCLGWGTFAVLASLEARGSDAALLHRVLLTGLALSIAGSLSNALGALLIFRPGSRLHGALVIGLAAGMIGGWGLLAVAPPRSDAIGFWIVLVSMAASYAWTGWESLQLYDALRRRARIGLADPLVANRALLWSVASLAVVTLQLSVVAARIVFGAHAEPDWLPTFQSGCGVVCAAAIWLGFFPPRRYARWVAETA